MPQIIIFVGHQAAKHEFDRYPQNDTNIMPASTVLTHVFDTIYIQLIIELTFGININNTYYSFQSLHSLFVVWLIFHIFPPILQHYIYPPF